MVEKTGVGKNAAIIDVGGGSSMLVDDLFAPTHFAQAILDSHGD